MPFAHPVAVGTLLVGLWEQAISGAQLIKPRFLGSDVPNVAAGKSPVVRRGRSFAHDMSPFLFLFVAPPALKLQVNGHR